MRSWTGAVTAFGVVVRIEQVLIQSLIGVFPTIPHSRKRKQLPLIYFKAKWLLGFSRSHPLVEPIGRNEAPAGFQRTAERWLRARRFRPSVDHAGSGGRLLPMMELVPSASVTILGWVP